jgi:secreted trypsin-like serine protease
MFIPRQYKGEIQNYFGDIAILVTHKTFVLSARVQPVCVDWGFKYDNALFDPTRKIFGHVSGWGYTIEYKQPSEVLKELEVPLINYEQCIQELPEDYEKFMTDDKLCAGYLNSGTSVCRGDSGGGLVFKFGKRYYVTAVVSLSPQAPTANGGCDSQRYALYTQISHYIEEFIIDKEARYRSSGSIECDQDPNCEGVTTDKPVTLITTPSSQSRPTLPNGNCLLPEHPTSGQWSVFGGGSVHTPGMSVTSESILRIRCSQGYQLDGKELVLCNNGSWSSPIGQCLKTCPSLVSTKTITIVCTFKNNETSKCINPPHGTIAKHVCAPFYEDLALVKNPVRVCRNGTWDSKKPECVPVCGQKAVSAQTLIINGKKAEKASYPWHVGIYRTENRRLVCNGALISQRLILTSAHCITDRNGVLLPKRRFTVAVGKLYSQFNSTRDVEAQYSTVEDMFIPLEYTGVKNNFLADIGLIVVQNSFTLSRSVQPVCVDWVLAYDDVSLHNVKNITGWVSGWGYTVAGANPADQLRELKVPLIPRNKCNQDLPENFQHLFTHDKLCAGYLNSSTSLCDGDGGGALVVKHEGRYYVTGIVSASPVSSAEICDSQQYALFTKVAQYNSFISEKEAQFRPFGNADCNNDEDPSICQKPTTETPSKTEGHRTSCILPEHPKFGSWLIYFGFSSSKFSPGMSVEEGTVLQVKCLDKYKLDGNSVILCENGKWNSEVGTCLKTCSSSYSTSTTKVSCFLKGKELENCIEPVEGTLAKYECATYYEDPQLAKNPINICLNGFWDQRQPNCVPVCGQKSVTAQTLIVNGNNVNKGDYPWHIAVYYGKNRRFMCGASLISQRLIVTSAQCVTDQKGNVHPKNDFIVAAGKYYRLYNHSGESNDAQFSTVQEIFVPEFYTATSGNYFGDIAILVTSIPFVLSQKVQPVCVDWSLIYENDMSNPSTNLTGYVTGWGFTSSDGASDLAKELKELKVPIINFNECFKKLPPDFTQFLTSDKLCAGYLNNGIAVCHGDSGGGLVVKFNSRYYITGIVSVSPRTNVGGCDIQQYALYTKISPYIDKFISRKQQQFRT